MTDTLNSYLAFVRAKARRAVPRGIAADMPLNPSLFGYQEDCVRFSLEEGSSAQFLDTGLGKSIIELEWARVIAEHTNLPVLMLAPLAVGPQHVRESAKFGIEAHYIRDPSGLRDGINICNYERLHLFTPAHFGGIVLDESSIVKSFGGKTSTALMQFAEGVPYRLAATATPAPNDHMELGQHSQFLGVMPSREMLARWFISDQSEMGKYRLKHHGVEDFWSWVGSWARMASMPSDLGYSDDGFVLPNLQTNLHFVDADIAEGAGDGELFRKVDSSATAIHKEKRITSSSRAERVAEIVAMEPNEAWVIWCETDYDADAITSRIPEACEVRGSMKDDEKEARLVAFSEGRERVLLTKPRMGGKGMNWQHCARTVFAGLTFSYEDYYQAVRRFHRFGQQRQVHVHIVMAETESIIWNTIKRKATDHENMKKQMVASMAREQHRRECKTAYRPSQSAIIPRWLKS